MISIASSHLRILQRPRIAPPRQQGPLAVFGLTHAIEAEGEVTFAGRSGEPLNGWRVGFAQAQYVDTRWEIFRGKTEAEGSVFVQAGRPPARPQQACFDGEEPGAIWYFAPGKWTERQFGKKGARPFTVEMPAYSDMPITVHPFHQDMPQAGPALFQVNTVTNHLNYLTEAQVEIAFCTALVARGPDNVPRFLHYFYWTVRWQYRFDRAASGRMVMVPTAVPGGCGCSVGRVTSGTPTDPRFREVIKGGQPTTCNLVARRAAGSPNLKAVTGWPSFDVRR